MSHVSRGEESEFEKTSEQVRPEVGFFSLILFPLESQLASLQFRFRPSMKDSTRHVNTSDNKLVEHRCCPCIGIVLYTGVVPVCIVTMATRDDRALSTVPSIMAWRLNNDEVGLLTQYVRPASVK